MTKKNEETFTIDGKQYEISKLADNQKYWIAQIQSLQAQENEMNFKLDPIKIAKNAFTNTLIQSLKEEEKKAS